MEHPPAKEHVPDAGREAGVDIRPALLRATTDLYVAKQRHSANEEAQFTELALRLIDLVDENTRAIVAAKLEAYPGAPKAVLARLAGESAAPPLPEPEPRAATVDSQPVTAETAFAGRRIAARELEALFFSGDAAERRLILLALDHSPIAPAAALAPQAAADAVRALERAALAHNKEAFAAELERTLTLSRAQALRIAADESGEPILILAAALDMPEDVLQRILLCLDPAIGQSVQRVYELASLHEEIDPQSAQRMIAIWQAAGRDADQDLGDTRPAATAPKPAPATMPRASAARRAAAERPPPMDRPRIQWDEHARHKADGA